MSLLLLSTFSVILSRLNFNFLNIYFTENIVAFIGRNILQTNVKYIIGDINAYKFCKNGNFVYCDYRINENTRKKADWRASTGRACYYNTFVGNSRNSHAGHKSTAYEHDHSRAFACRV